MEDFKKEMRRFIKEQQKNTGDFTLALSLALLRFNITKDEYLEIGI